MKRIAVVCTLLAAVAACAPANSRIIVAAGTTIVDSGFIDHVVASFEEVAPDVEVSVVGQPTKLALALGREGAADVTITHAPDQEASLVADGQASAPTAVFASRFLLVGPASIGDRFEGWELPEVLRDVFTEGLAFVSRGDGSGTHDKEMENWLEAGFDPVGASWYIETGQGMGPTLLIADQRSAMTLVERGAFVAALESLGLSDLGLDAGALDNPYTAMVMASSDNLGDAQRFVEWLGSEAGADAIARANSELFGEVIYASGPGG